MNAARVSEFGQEGAAAFSRKKRGQFPEHAFGTRRAATGCCHSDKDPHALAAVDPHSTCAAAFTGIVLARDPVCLQSNQSDAHGGPGSQLPVHWKWRPGATGVAPNIRFLSLSELSGNLAMSDTSESVDQRRTSCTGGRLSPDPSGRCQRARTWRTGRDRYEEPRPSLTWLYTGQRGGCSNLAK